MHGAVYPCQHLRYSGYLPTALELECGQPILPARLHTVERSLPQSLADTAFADFEHPGSFPRGKGRSEQGHVLGRPPARRHLGDDVEHKASRLLGDVLRTPPYPTIPELLVRKLHSHHSLHNHLTNAKSQR